MNIINPVRVKKKLTGFLLSIILCFCCLPVSARTQPIKLQKNKSFYSKFFNHLKKQAYSYKTQLETKYYEELLKKNPNDIKSLKLFAEHLKNHKKYNKSIKIYNQLIQITKDDKYKANIDEINSFKNYARKNKKFLNYIKQAQFYESQSNIAQANKYYLNAEKIFPNRIEVKFGLAKTYGWLNKQKLAKAYYQDILKKAPNNTTFLKSYTDFLDYNNKYVKAINDKIFSNYINRALNYESHSKISKANKAYLKAEHIYPKRYEAIYGLAKTYGWLHKTELAKAYYQKLLKISPDNQNLINTYHKFLKESKRGRSNKKQSTKANSQNYQAQAKINKLFSTYIKQAQFYENNAKTTKANEYYLKAQKLNPNRYEPKFGLAKTYGWMHKNKLALKYYQELLKQTPKNIALLEAYANYLKDSKKLEKSMNVYKKLLAQTKNKKYNTNIAEILLLEQNYETSLKLYTNIYNKNQKNPEVQKSIALLYFMMGNFDKSIKFYEKYFNSNNNTKTINSHSIVNYAKGLFYTKNISHAKEILETFLKKNPNNAEGLNTLSEIYVAIKRPKKAKILTNRAIELKPTNIRYKLQLARIYISTENYSQAQKILLHLLTIEPNNHEILENLGDVNYNKGNFEQALYYFKIIPTKGISSPKYIKKINFKIAQAHHYNKDYILAESIYKQFINEPEYSNRAKIGIAEIKISEDKPLLAQPLLNSVIKNDPKNIQAKKNLGISFFSMGEPFKSIKILKKIPKNDADINDIKYNLAKAYDKIGRKDTALELLKDNPQKNARILKNEILMQTKSTIKPIYDYYYMDPNNGNVNAGQYQKTGAKAYYYIKPNLRAMVTGNTTKYSNLNNLVSTRATLGSIGLEGQPTDHISFTSAIGYDIFAANNNYPSNKNIILGNAIVKASPNDVITLTTGYIRSIDEIDSYMSAAGVVPTIGPFANQLVGRIVDNKYIMALALKLPHKFYVYGGMNIGNKYGSYSPSNVYREIPCGFGKVVYSAKEEKPINQALIGYDFYYTGYNYDRSGFGGANLGFNPVGSDGQSPNPQSGFPGVGGYFSPTFFIANKIPITLKGSFKKTKLKYVLSGFVGTQTIEGQIGLEGPTAGGQSRIKTTPYFGYSIGLKYNEKGKYGWGTYYTFNNYMTVAQHLLKVFLFMRF